jgi:hypothetical protein
MPSLLVVCPKDTGAIADASLWKQFVASKLHRSFRPLNKEKCLGLVDRIDLVLLKRSPATKDAWKLYSKVLLHSLVSMGRLLYQQMEIINSEQNQGLFISYIKKYLNYNLEMIGRSVFYIIQPWLNSVTWVDFQKFDSLVSASFKLRVT